MTTPRIISVLALEHERDVERAAQEKAEKEAEKRRQITTDNIRWWETHGRAIFVEKFGLEPVSFNGDSGSWSGQIRTSEGLTFAVGYISSSSKHYLSFKVKGPGNCWIGVDTRAHLAYYAAENRLYVEEPANAPVST